jgi:hypothetical protein
MSFPTRFTKKTSYKDYGQKHLLIFTAVHAGNKKEQFYAFLTNFSQNFNSTWNSETVYGRNDPIGTFQGTQRTINLSWDIPSGNITEAKANLKRFGNLTKFLYPGYSKGPEVIETDDGSARLSTNALTLSKSPLVRIKFSNLINDGKGNGLLGWIGTLSWQPVLEMGYFEESTGMYPKVTSLSLDFTVQHEQDLGWKKSSFIGKSSFPFKG